jgi:uracil-DNA glycosylase
MSGGESLAALLKRVRACTLCAAHLPLGPRPILRARASARLMIVGQAPGTRVHETGVPWNDRSGDRLRQWLDLDRERFYDEARVAIVPMGFCYPGRDAHGGDRPPRPECAPTWHPAIRARLPAVELTLLVGTYAQGFYLGGRRKESVGETVRAWRDYLPGFLPLPHPSWRNTAWLRKNPWFETELVPELRRRVAALVGPQDIDAQSRHVHLHPASRAQSSRMGSYTGRRALKAAPRVPSSR